MELAMDTPVSIRTCCAKYTWMSIDNPWLSIDNLRSDFEHSEGGNVHTSRDVLGNKKKDRGGSQILVILKYSNDFVRCSDEFFVFRTTNILEKK